MAIPRMPGGRRPIDDDLARMALGFLGVFLLLMFLMMVRIYFDARSGKPVQLRPVRSPRPVVERVVRGSRDL